MRFVVIIPNTQRIPGSCGRSGNVSNPITITFDAEQEKGIDVIEKIAEIISDNGTDISEADILICGEKLALPKA